MSNSVSFKDADHVIEQFGGIRPFASKLGVPVTTVQGWKKRNSIPDTRWQEIQKLAREMNLDLTDANDNVKEPVVASLSARTATAPQATPYIREKAPKRGYSFSQGVLVTLVSVGLSLGVLAILFGPDFVVSNPGQRLAVLEDKVNGTATPGAPAGEWQGVAATLQQGQRALEETINGTVMPRLNELQATVGTLGDAESLQQLAANIKTMQSSTEGQAKLDAAVLELQALVKGLQGEVGGLDTALADVQKQNSALSETIGKVSTTDLTAAAMLLALNQFRSALDRQEPLQDDIALLKSVVNPDENPDLAASIDRLTPFAASGVMSVSGLQTELQTVTGAIVEARLKGDKAPWQDIVKARFQQVFDVRNNGVPVLGTAEQKAVALAQKQLAAGDVAAAKATLEALPAPSREAAQPFILKADQNLVARQVESDVTRYFSQSLQGLTTAPSTASASAPVVAPEQTPPTTGIAPVAPAEEAPIASEVTAPEAEILETAPVTPEVAPEPALATPSAEAPPAPPAAAQPEGAQPAQTAPSL